MKYPSEWESCECGVIPIDRVKVPGGWLVREVIYSNDDQLLDVKLLFLSDPKHAWECE